MVQCEKRAKGRQVTESDRRVLREAPFQIIRECLRPGRIPREGECKGSAILHVPALEKLKSCHRALPCCRRITEKGFPQCCSGFPQSRSFPLGRLLSQVRPTL